MNDDHAIESQGGEKMKFAVAVLLFCGFMAFGPAQENAVPQRTDSPAIGLPVGSTAPSFSFLDQFDHPQSNETLKGSNGTVLLFFRSADW
jgi:hypothetical protein